MADYLVHVNVMFDLREYHRSVSSHQQSVPLHNCTIIGEVKCTVVRCDERKHRSGERRENRVVEEKKNKG